MKQHSVKAVAGLWAERLDDRWVPARGLNLSAVDTAALFDNVAAKAAELDLTFDTTDVSFDPSQPVTAFDQEVGPNGSQGTAAAGTGPGGVAFADVSVEQLPGGGVSIFGTATASGPGSSSAFVSATAVSTSGSSSVSGSVSATTTGSPSSNTQTHTAVSPSFIGRIGGFKFTRVFVG